MEDRFFMNPLTRSLHFLLKTQTVEISPEDLLLRMSFAASQAAHEQEQLSSQT